MVRLTRALAAIALLTAVSAQAHLIVDMKMSLRAPAFVPAGQPFTIDVVADNLANDNAIGLVVTDTLPTGATFVGATAPNWNCGASKGVVTCSAEQLGPGEHVISISVNAPTQTATRCSASTASASRSTTWRPRSSMAPSSPMTPTKTATSSSIRTP